MFETDTRTSGNGLSSSLIASESDSILAKGRVKENGGELVPHFMELSLMSCSSMLGVKLSVAVLAMVEGCRFLCRDSV